MMKVLYLPQRSDQKVAYSFKGESVTVHYNGESETFDFSIVENHLESVQSTLGIHAITSVYRVDGVLHLELLRFYKNEETSVLFPDWIDVG